MNVLQQREELSQGLLGGGYSELTEVQRSVVDLIANEAPTSISPVLVGDDRTFWERTSDALARVGGSWTFIGGFCLALAVWIAVNLALSPGRRAFDPYPFIFLNLVLSTVAALQAPLILMSQNRQAERDRSAAEHDYKVNLRAELEILRLHDRLQFSQEQLHRIEAAITALNRP